MPLSAVKEILPSGITSVVCIDLTVIQENYATIQNLIAPAEAAAVLKANAYGLGAAPIARALYQVGCRRFFVITPQEGVEIKAALEGVTGSAFSKPLIYCLQGLLEGTEDLFLEHQFIPVLCTLEQIQRWRQRSLEQKLPCIIHVDTGMTRNGLDALSWEAFTLQSESLLQHLDVHYYMSHLPCSDNVAFSRLQRDNFLSLIKKVPFAPASLSNGDALFLDKHMPVDLARVGLALYGLTLMTEAREVLKVAVGWYGQILQINPIPAGATVGYNCTFTASHPMRVATLGLGYADGIPLLMGNVGTVRLGPFVAPIIGRVSMDFITVDVTHIPEDYAYTGAWATLLDESTDISTMMRDAQTHPHELLTRIGPRVARVYSSPFKS